MRDHSAQVQQYSVGMVALLSDISKGSVGDRHAAGMRQSKIQRAEAGHSKRRGKLGIGAHDPALIRC